MNINRTVSPKVIERWKPKTMDQIVGNGRLKKVMQSLYLSHGREANVLIVGATGTCKTSIANLTLGMLACETFSPSATGPCHTCKYCREIDSRSEYHGLFLRTRNDDAGNELPSLHTYRVNASRTTSQEVFEILDECRYFNDPTLIFVDEAQYFRKFELDERILVDMDFGNITWIISTSKPELLDGAFLRRMGGPVPTESPSREELEKFVVDRCTEFQISHDKPETVSSLVVRSGFQVCEVIRFLVCVAREHQYNFDLGTVRKFDFHRYSTSSQ